MKSEGGSVQPNRRQMVASALILAAAAPAKADARHEREPSGNDNNLTAKLQVSDLINRERNARDAGDWGEMTACWRADAIVDVSWLKGSAPEFIARTRRNAASGRVTLHSLSPSVVTLQSDRAIAETPCRLASFVPIDGVEVCITGYVRLLWRADRKEGDWGLAGLRMIYIRDTMVPSDPNDQPQINSTELSGYRASYRWLSYALARTANKPRDDLPGIDRPETVAAIREAQSEWLAGI
ncbi:nuclear transport factor 2 family protein [Stakelama tenebrarum]|uniref:Nuclear transport factor 2 family protein n=1 Tax=Stakelama tenebrarum TaxID=2711215 RepID=A0A6G6Y110_9SPHN|nr:nuclear transport factor 2 family protein [Sphingosinithalassobacter tenebrarum]QIG78615.1 nuclear transport factor 2 family protein [Sphingosinithalassobacter tenebrarum]